LKGVKHVWAILRSFYRVFNIAWRDAHFDRHHLRRLCSSIPRAIEEKARRINKAVVTTDLSSFRYLSWTAVKTPGTFGDYNPEGVLAAAFTPDGKTLVSVAIPNEIRLWDVATGKHSKMQKTGREIGQWGNAAFTPDAKTVATSQYGDTSIMLSDVATGKARATLKGQKGNSWSLTFSPDGKTLASGDDKGTITL
jgi:WD40 repeat protein